MAFWVGKESSVSNWHGRLIMPTCFAAKHFDILWTLVSSTRTPFFVHLDNSKKMSHLYYLTTNHHDINPPKNKPKTSGWSWKQRLPLKTNQTPQNQKISWKPLVQLDELPTAHQLCFPLAQSLGEVLGSCSLTPAPPKHRRHGQRTQELNFVDGSDVILNSQQGNKKPFNKQVLSTSKLILMDFDFTTTKQIHTWDEL